VVVGKANLTFVQLCWQNQLQLNEGTMPLFLFSNNQTSIPHTIAGAFAARFSPQ
jgi:hypothetical protein